MGEKLLLLNKMSTQFRSESTHLVNAKSLKFNA